jgi:hypothetical protein
MTSLDLRQPALMRTARVMLLACSVGVVLGLSVLRPAQEPTGPRKVRLRLVDAETGKSVGGIVHVTGSDEQTVQLAGLFDRMAGLTKDLPGVHWYVVPAGGVEALLPRDKLHLKAVSGIETGTAEIDVDLRATALQEITLKLPFLFRPEDAGLVAGNTHLHLRGFAREVADEYLRRIPAADRLRVLFISYLERDKEDPSYITNEYPLGDLSALSTAGVLINNGEEHRHNFLGFGEGYGHVMFLNIKKVVQPVSIGPGITNRGFDDPALRLGIDDARGQGGTVLWCHNTFGFEDVPSALAGRLHALNVFDGSRIGKYEDNYYRYLNIGLRMPISTGTDWFMYDFSRVYAEVRGKLTIASWLEAVKAGRCQATNGPFLTLQVNGKKPGEVIELDAPTTVKIEASAHARFPLERLELIQNGRVVKTQPGRAGEPGRIELSHAVRVDEPAWFALRSDASTKSEFQRTLFAHTSPVYVNYQRRGVFNVEAALALLKQIEDGQAAVTGRGRFSSPAAQQKVLALYDEAAADLKKRLQSARR